ncbi:hypothetical protein [Pedobacter faecalis]|uniref:hypothetical protein n=1 Tax=Pedobacter faecalis TaxID=3041495 RepID=UPI002550D64F|nr:hypothetical protein [Pedobacter sp. ELA7]
MKTILIPTDFSTDSLRHVPDLCSGRQDETVAVLFVHLFRLSDSISELLLLSRRSREYEYISDEFYTACEKLRKQVPNLVDLRIEFFYGSTISVFKNFIEANGITNVLHPDLWVCGKLNKFSVEPGQLVTRCGLPLLRTAKQVERSNKALIDSDEYTSLSGLADLPEKSAVYEEQIA